MLREIKSNYAKIFHGRLLFEWPETPPLWHKMASRGRPPHQLRHSQNGCDQNLAGAPAPHNHVHFTPTSASWINQVERWFAELTRKQIRRGVHTSTQQLETDIRALIERHNENPKPYRWTKSAGEILASIKPFCQKTEQTLCREYILIREFAPKRAVADQEAMEQFQKQWSTYQKLVDADALSHRVAGNLLCDALFAIPTPPGAAFRTIICQLSKNNAYSKPSAPQRLSA